MSKAFILPWLLTLLVAHGSPDLAARTIVVWNSDVPASRELADGVARDQGGGPVELLEWSFGTGDGASPGSVKAFRKRFLDDRSVTAVVLAFEAPRHHRL